ncbi:phage major capsid protein [Zhongshania guokunii]|uniref:Phage major capsid protein n=1 Tax=Zhongshania guokunii TaxID=641783 RepID=A0ABV3U5F9_9GAMM
MFKFKLSAPFVLLSIAVAAMVPVTFGVALNTIAAAAFIIVFAGFLAERAPAGYVGPHTSMQRGEVGEPGDVKKQVLDAIKGHSDELTRAIAKTETDIKEHGQVLESTKNEIVVLSEKGSDLEARLGELEQRSVRGDGSDAEEKKTLGQMFVDFDGFKEFAGKQKHKGQSPLLELKDITSGSSSAGDGIWSFRDPEIVSDPYRPRMLRSLIPTVPVGSNLVEWVQTNVRTNNADMVSETGLKPKSNITYDRKETPVRKIAHYFKTSTEVLSDFARLRAEIDNEGFEMLRQVEEDQLMQGDGTGINLLGLVPQATAYNVGSTQSGDQQVDVIRRAILQVRQSFYGATGIVMNPADWAAIELLKDGENRYLFSAVTTGAPARLWGLPVVESDAIDAGEFMVGAFSTAAAIYDRMQAAVYMSTENEDDFINNMVSILFEERLALAVKRPLAFVHGNLSGAS